MHDVVKLENVTVRRGSKYLLSEVSWEVADGERWVILGPNGAGKTTLLNILAAQMHPTSGVVGLLGETLGRVDVFELRPRIGQTSAALAERVPPGEAAVDVVVSAGYGVLGRWTEDYAPEDYAQAEMLMEAFGVGSLRDRTFGTLSSGEKKRVQIARALMTDPELLLLDEPSAGLDLGGREEVVAALGELASEPAAPVSILVTHHVEEIPPGYTHAMLIREGAVVAAGPIDLTLTSENLGQTFGLDLVVAYAEGRWTARAR
ncbi:ABC transporter ATP-binding protein [Micrococcales bacterium 31B]|nr:ABC transporter ATP-binding protein [Micrococcales bacterium 31B]